MVYTSQLTKLPSSLAISIAQIFNWTLFILEIIYNTQLQEPVTDCLKGSQLSNKFYHAKSFPEEPMSSCRLSTSPNIFATCLHLFILFHQLDRVVTIAGFAGKSAIFLIFARKSRN